MGDCAFGAHACCDLTKNAGLGAGVLVLWVERFRVGLPGRGLCCDQEHDEDSDMNLGVSAQDEKLFVVEDAVDACGLMMNSFKLKARRAKKFFTGGIVAQNRGSEIAQRWIRLCKQGGQQLCADTARLVVGMNTDAYCSAVPHAQEGKLLKADDAEKMLVLEGSQRKIRRWGNL
jgi:hypothetical protein